MTTGEQTHRRPTVGKRKGEHFRRGLKPGARKPTGLDARTTTRCQAKGCREYVRQVVLDWTAEGELLLCSRECAIAAGVAVPPRVLTSDPTSTPFVGKTTPGTDVPEADYGARRRG